MKTSVNFAADVFRLHNTWKNIIVTYMANMNVTDVVRFEMDARIRGSFADFDIRKNKISIFQVTERGGKGVW